MAGVDSDEAFGAMIERHRRYMTKVAAGIVGPGEAEDVAQDAALLAWRHRDQFDGRHPGGWLATIVRNRALGLVRRRHFVTVALDHLPERADPAQEPEAGALAREVGEAILMALAACSDEEADALLRCCRDGQKYREAAADLGVPVTTINKRLHKARGRVKKSLGGG